MLDIYLDADASPVKEDTFRVSKRYGLRVYVVSNRPIFLPKADYIIPIVVENEFDAVDHYIAGRATKGDIVITNDILLAERCLKNEARVINPRGKVYDVDNIGEALATRELLQELRQRGDLNTGPSKKKKEHHSSFLSALDLVINQIKKANRE